MEKKLRSIGSKIRQDDQENWEKESLWFKDIEVAKECKCDDPGKCMSRGAIRYGKDGIMFCERFLKWERQERVNKKVSKILPEKLRKLSFKQFDDTVSEQSKQAYELCKKYYTKKLFLKGSNVILSGSYVTGKSHLASAVIHNCMIDNYSAGFVTASALNRGGFDDIEKRFEAMKQCDVVVIDDLATETDNPLILRHLFDFINYRYEVEKGIIITTNFNKDLFRESVGDRIFDRLEERSRWIEIKDVGSYRKKITKYNDW